MNFAIKLTKLVNTASILVKHAEMISESSTHLYASKTRHIQPIMTPTMTPDNGYQDVPGNPSTAKSSIQRLNDRSNGQPLKVLSEWEWGFWQQNGYLVIRKRTGSCTAFNPLQLINILL